MLLKLLTQAGCPVHLACAIVLYLLIGVGPVQLDNPLTTIDFTDHGLSVGTDSTEQEDGALSWMLTGLFDDPGGVGIKIRSFHHLDHSLDRLALTGQTRLQRAIAHLQSGGSHQSGHYPRRGKRTECLPQCFVENAAALNGSNRDISPLLLDVQQFFAQKVKLAVLARQGNKRVIQKKFDCVTDLI